MKENDVISVIEQIQLAYISSDKCAQSMAWYRMSFEHGKGKHSGSGRMRTKSSRRRMALNINCFNKR